ncbi:hypothetical protein [Natronorarus salvus]|uniref:hypothetical protein n=1 Tax=Natronorarus salvus TaxID=3117733 RepID=UPI002F26AE9A
MTKTEITRELFESLNELNLTYVVASKYKNLPETIIGDIDIYVEDQDFDKAIEICKGLGLEKRQSLPKHIYLLKKVVRDPWTAFTTVFNSPRKIQHLIRNEQKRATGSEYSYHRNQKMVNDELMIDIRNNLAYKSLQDRTRIPVKSSVTNQFFKRRRPYNGFYVPAPCDELAHIISRQVFDKDGAFSHYYVNRCDELVETLRNDPEQNNQFRDLLCDIFYDTDKLIYDLIIRRKYDVILSELYRNRATDEIS